MSTSWAYHEYIGGGSVHRGDTMRTSGGYYAYIGGYHGYIRGCSVHWGNVMMHVGDTMNTLGDVQYIERYHKYIGGIS